MAKIQRYEGNLQAFASAATGQERVIFGNDDSPPVQSDDLTTNINSNFARGWGVLPLGNKPPREWFNAVAFAATQLSAYQHQVGVPEWDDEQEYHAGSIVNVGGVLYSSLEDDNVGNTPASSQEWELSRKDGAISVLELGAVGDAVYSETGNISSGSNSFTDLNGQFSSDDEGKVISIYQAGVTPERLNTTILSVQSPTSVTLSDSATASPPANEAKYVYGTDNAEAFNEAMQSKYGVIVIPSGKYLVNSRVYVPSQTCVKGSVVGGSVVYHPQTPFLSTQSPGVRDVLVENLTGNACASADGFVSMSGARDVTVRDCNIENTKNLGVTVGIGFGKAAGFNSSNLRVINCKFNVADYGVVFDSASGNGLMSNCEVSGCYIRTFWGSCVSLSGHVQDVSISDSQMVIAGIGAEDKDSGGAQDGVGIGVKLWNGSSDTVKPKNVSVIGCSIRGEVFSGDLYQGVSVANHSSQVSISACSFDDIEHAIYCNYSNSGESLTVSSCHAKNCGYLFYNNISSDYRPVISSCQAIDCRNGIRTSLLYGSISGCRFSNIEDGAITLHSFCTMGNVSNNIFESIGEHCVKTESNGTSNELLTISSNNINNSCTKSDSSYDTFDLNDRPHNVTGNTIRNEDANRPRYIIGGTGENRVVTSNFLFGGSAYYETPADASDVFGLNKERGL